MASEDAAVLRQALRTVKTPSTLDTQGSSSLSSVLQTYQSIRQPRVSYLQKAGRRLQYEYHLDDGALQRERDEWITHDDVRNPIFWGHKDRREWLFAYDAEEDTEVKLESSPGKAKHEEPTQMSYAALAEKIVLVKSTQEYCNRAPGYHASNTSQS